jgi:hypothetical protein
MKHIFGIIAIAFAITAFIGCDDDADMKNDPVFNGKDNYIASFALTVDGISYNALIADDRILVKVPYDVPLKDATASCLLSENASINPNPADISDWGNEWQFIVTSSNKTNKVYRYSYQYDDIAESGSVVLATQADIDQFKNRRINSIDGNLIIGTDNGEDISNLDGLCNLEKVTNSVIIKTSYKGGNISLPALQRVGSFKIGTLEQFSNNSTLETISLPVLEMITGDLIIRQATVANIDLPALKTVGETFNITSNVLTTLNTNALTSVGNDFVVSGTTDGKTLSSPSEVFAFPGLQKVGGNMTVQYLPKLAAIDCSVLQSVGGGVTFNDLALGGLLFPKATEFGGITIRNIPLYVFQAPVLSQCGAVTFDKCTEIGEIDMSSLSIVNGDLYFNNLTTLSHISGLSALEEIHGKLTLSNVPINSMDPLSKLATLTGMTIINTNIEVIDARGCEFNGGILELDNNSRLYSFLADDDFNGSVKINPTNKFIQVGEFSMTGFHNVTGDFSLAGYVYMESLSLPVETVKGDFSFDCGQANNVNLKQVNIPNLREIGGQCTLQSFGSVNSCSVPNLEKVGKILYIRSQSTCMITLPKLRSIGESIDPGSGTFQSDLYLYNGNADEGKTLSLPELEVVNTRLRFRTDATRNCLYQTISLPSLKRVNGNLAFSGYSTPITYQNNTLTTISMPQIEYVENVSFLNMGILSDVSSFVPLFQSGVIDNAIKWSIINCPNIPTYAQMQAGQYTLP